MYMNGINGVNIDRVGLFITELVNWVTQKRLS